MATEKPKTKDGQSADPSAGQLCVEFSISGIWSAINVYNKGGSDVLGPSMIAIRAQDEGLGIPEHLTYLAIERDNLKNTHGLEALAEMPMAQDFLYILLDGHVITIDGHGSGAPGVKNSFGSVAKMADYFPSGNRLAFDRRYVPDSKSEPDPQFVSAFFRFGNGRLGANEVTPGEWVFKGKDQASPPAQDYYAQAITYCFEVPGPTITLRIRDLQQPSSTPLVLTFPPKGNHVRIHLGNSMPKDIPHVLLRKEGAWMMTQHWIALHKVKGVPPPDGPLPEPAGSEIVIMSPSGGLCGPGYGGP